MNEAAAAARREYKRQWRAKNRDKCRAAEERYWQKKAQAAAAQDQPANDPAAATK